VAADEFSDRSGLLLMSSGDPVLYIRNYAFWLEKFDQSNTRADGCCITQANGCINLIYVIMLDPYKLESPTIRCDIRCESPTIWCLSSSILKM